VAGSPDQQQVHVRAGAKQQGDRRFQLARRRRRGGIRLDRAPYGVKPRVVAP
jgi:hypothetical protein